MNNTLKPADVATKLDISGSTLRKYCLLLEENGVTFKRNAKNSRQFTDSDVMTLQKMITLMRTDGVTVENAAFAVSSKAEKVFNKTGGNDVISNDTERQNDDVTGITLNEIRKLQEEVKKQRETIEKFRKSQDERDVFFVEILEKLQGEIQQLNEKALPAPEKEPEIELLDQDKPAPKRRGFFSRLFK